MNGWTQGEVIALFGVIVTGLGVAVPVMNPELRCFLFKDCQAIKGDHPNSDISTTGSEASAVGADYTKLKELLVAEDFKGADKETSERMFWVAHREKN